MRSNFRPLQLALLIIIAAVPIIQIVSFAHYPVRCTAELSRYSAMAGDKITYAIHVTSKSDVEVDIPDVADALAKFRIIDSGRSKEGFLGRARSSLWYTFTQYAPGTYTIAPAVIRYREPGGDIKKMESDQVALIVKSAFGDKGYTPPDVEIGSDLASGPGALRTDEARSIARRKTKTPVVIKIVDAGGPASLLTPVDIVVAGAEAALLLFIAGWAFKVLRKKIIDAGKATPYESALGEIGAVKKNISKNALSAQQCCARIASMLKRYVKEEFKAGPGELTTEEFLKELRAISAASDELQRTAEGVLSLCDLAEFSGYNPSREELEECIGGAEKILVALNTLKENNAGET